MITDGISPSIASRKSDEGFRTALCFSWLLKRNPISMFIFDMFTALGRQIKEVGNFCFQYRRTIYYEFCKENIAPRSFSFSHFLHGLKKFFFASRAIKWPPHVDFNFSVCMFMKLCMKMIFQNVKNVRWSTTLLPSSSFSCSVYYLFILVP